MSVTIELPPELEEIVRLQAARDGLDVRAFVLQAVQEKITKVRNVDEICAPFVQAVEGAGINEEEFDQFFDEVREEVWQEKQGQRP
ncbi:MAG TPA: hypothetical protein VGP68_22985 [Gemmataceae bacterium]|jgi:hypothetical protein|nr:hypothetical protein [Gemmataceae bacterium]